MSLAGPGAMNGLRPARGTAQPAPAQPIRYLNELRALDVLFREGAMSRADLARALGLNRSTTGSIIANLLSDALVVEDARPEGPRPGGATPRTGRPGIEIGLDPAGAVFVGATIEADHLVALAVDLSGAVIRKKTAPFHAARHTPARAAEAVAKLINALIAAEPNRARVYGACVAVPGTFRDGVLLRAALLGWRDVDLRPLIAAHLSMPLPVIVENDANAFAVAETYRGPAAGTVAFVLIDSGAGGGIVHGGRLMRGGLGLAGEFGHLRVGRRGFAEGRGDRGTLETFVGREAVLARYRGEGGPPGARLADLVAALERGEAPALRTAAAWGHWLARGLVSIVNVVDPSLIIVGGPVGALLGFARDRVEAGMRAGLPRGVPAAPVELSRFGPEGPAYGAALMLHQRAFSVDERALYPDGGGRSLFPQLDA